MFSKVEYSQKPFLERIGDALCDYSVFPLINADRYEVLSDRVKKVTSSNPVYIRVAAAISTLVIGFFGVLAKFLSGNLPIIVSKAVDLHQKLSQWLGENPRPEEIEATKRITSALLQQKSELNLSGLDLRSLPDELCWLCTLKKLNISNNPCLSSLPKTFEATNSASLRNLYSISFDKTAIGKQEVLNVLLNCWVLRNDAFCSSDLRFVEDTKKAVHRVLEAFNQNAQILDLSDLKINSIPPLGVLTHLKQLKIGSNNEITDLASELEKISSLQIIVEPGDRLKEQILGFGLQRWLESSWRQGHGRAANQIKIFNGQKLDLSGLRLTSLPPYLSLLHTLEELDLTKNFELTALPEELVSLKNLVHISFNGTAIPKARVLDIALKRWLDQGIFKEQRNEAVKRIKSAFESDAEQLDLSNLCLRELPPEIYLLESVKQLNLSGNTELTIQQNPVVNNLLTEFFAQMSVITEMDKTAISRRDKLRIGLKRWLAGVEISCKEFCPSWEETHNKLKIEEDVLKAYDNILAKKDMSLLELNLSNYSLKSLPKEFSFLNGIVSLNLSYNNFEELPDSILRLTSLKNLDLSKNCLRSLPVAIGNLQELACLEINENNIDSLPISFAFMHQLRRLEAKNSGLVDTLCIAIDSFTKFNSRAFTDKVSWIFEFFRVYYGSGENFIHLGVKHREVFYSWCKRLVFNVYFESKQEQLATLIFFVLRSLNQSTCFNVFLGELDNRDPLIPISKVLEKQLEKYSDGRLGVNGGEAIQRIVDAFNERREELDLSRLKLPVVPAELWGLGLLKVLRLDDNPELHELPEHLSHIRYLENISFHGTKIPDETVFETLMQSWLGPTPNSKKLDKAAEIKKAYKERYSYWLRFNFPPPPAIRMLSKLNHGHLEFHGFDAHNTTGLLHNFDQLEVLDISSCNLQCVPEAIRTLRGLKILQLCNNKISHLPSWIEELTSLKILDLSGGNMFKTFPESILRLPALDTLRIDKNLIQKIPLKLEQTKRRLNLELTNFHQHIPYPLMLQSTFKSVSLCIARADQYQEFIEESFTGHRHIKKYSLRERLSFWSHYSGFKGNLKFVAPQFIVNREELGHFLGDSLKSVYKQIITFSFLGSSSDDETFRVKLWKDNTTYAYYYSCQISLINKALEQLGVNPLNEKQLCGESIFTPKEQELINSWLIDLEQLELYRNVQQPLAYMVCDALSSLKNKSLHEAFFTALKSENDLLPLASILEVRLRGWGDKNPSENVAVAIDRIMQAFKLQSSSLDLSYLDLKDLPSEICWLIKLEYLNVQGNSRLSSLGENFHRIAHFVSINAQETNIAVTDQFEAGYLKWSRQSEGGFNENRSWVASLMIKYFKESGPWRLTLLGDSKNAHEMEGIGCLPEVTGMFHSLKKLEMLQLGMKNLPSSFQNLTYLTTINFSKNAFDEFLTVLTRMPWVQELDLSHNRITRLPSTIGLMTSLKTLNVSNNLLSSLPVEIGSLTSLEGEGLDLTNNPILANVPMSIVNLTKLTHLCRLGTRIPEHIILYLNSVWQEARFSRFSDPNSFSDDVFANTLNTWKNWAQTNVALSFITRSTVYSVEKLERLFGITITYADMGLSLNGSSALVTFTKACPESPVLPAKLRLQMNQKLLDIDREQMFRLWLPHLVSPDVRRLARTYLEDELQDLTFVETGYFSLRQKKALKEWLYRLSFTNDFSRKQHDLAKKACDMLTALTDLDYREQFLAIVESNNERCRDRSAMTFIILHALYLVHTLDPTEAMQQLVGIAKTLALINALTESIECYEVQNQYRLDESVETYLYYIIKLKDKLSLVTPIEHMQYETIGRRSWIDEGALCKAVNENYLKELLDLSPVVKMLREDDAFMAALEKNGADHNALRLQWFDKRYTCQGVKKEI